MAVPADFAAARASAQLDRLYAEALKHSQDTELNLRFAREAEAAGVLRWALSAYERATINDPGNAEAQASLQRIRRKLQPNFSQMTLALGSAVETNPRFCIGPRRTEFEGLASAVLFDERALGDIRWRTTGAGNIHSKSHDLDYNTANLDTGPVLDVFPGWSLVPALGGAASYYDGHFYYGEGFQRRDEEIRRSHRHRDVALSFRPDREFLDLNRPRSLAPAENAQLPYSAPAGVGA